MGENRHYMMRAIELAKRAEGMTSPNPMVGCVVVKGAVIVGEGFHAGPGCAHAEVAALRAAGIDAQGATAYVTLEPCAHTGRTPPCTDALIKAGIAEVVYAVCDPNPLAAGGGAILEAAGIKVSQGLCQTEGRELIKHWLHSQALHRPYVTVKFAASLDGRIATRKGDSKWITSEVARLRGHDLRKTHDAIIVGAQTVVMDDPTLTARPAKGGRSDGIHPIRFVLDSEGRTPLDAKILRATTPGKTILVATKAIPQLKMRALESRGIDVWVLDSDRTGRPSLPQLLSKMHDHDIISVLVEGGGRVHGSFFDAGLVDEVWAFLAPMIIGGGGHPAVGGEGPALLREALRLENTDTEHLDGTVLLRGRIARHEEASACLQA